MALLSRFFGRTASEGAAYAFGVATGPVLAPATESVRQEAWKFYSTRIPAVGVLAEGVAQGQVDVGTARDWAARQGFGKDAFDALVNVANVGPGSGFAFELWRRGVINDAGFKRALLRLGLEQEWIDDLVQIRDVLLTPDVLANARQQGFVDEGRQKSESALQGITDDRAEILFELSGNPPGPETMQRAVNRGLADEATFRQAIREGRTKTKYTDLLYELRQPILSAATYVRSFLKGHITRDQMHAGGALWGYTPADLDLWYESEGRPATVHQIHIGYARGSKLPGAANEEDAIRKSVAQSDIRPEYADLLYASRYTYPSAFVLRGLVQAGSITRDEGEQALLFSGWEPTLAAKVADAWANTGSGTAEDTHLSKAQTQLWGTTHRSYLNREITPTVARNALGQAGVPAASIAGVLGVWDVERDLIRKQLTPAQIKKALAKGARNAATGQPWTRDEALAALIALGYNATTANDYLDIP